MIRFEGRRSGRSAGSGGSFTALTSRADALFDLMDAVLCADGPVRSMAGLSLVVSIAGARVVLRRSGRRPYRRRAVTYHRRAVVCRRPGHPDRGRRRLRRTAAGVAAAGPAGAGAGPDALRPGAAPRDAAQDPAPARRTQARHGGEFVFGDPTNCGDPGVATRTDTRLYGATTARAWPRSSASSTARPTGPDDTTVTGSYPQPGRPGR